jgi:hypothetical protein
MRIYLLYFIYGVILFALFPLLQFEIYKATDTYEKADPFFIWFRIFFSGPLLLFLGIALIALFKDRVHKIFGFISIIIGVYWLILLIKDFN